MRKEIIRSDLDDFYNEIITYKNNKISEWELKIIINTIKLKIPLKY